MTRHSQYKVLILGGGYAGLMAASRLTRGGSRAEVTLIDAKPSFVQRIRLHEALAGGSPKTLDYASLLGRRGVRFVQARVESLEPGRRLVVARNGAGERVELGYDTLILALGSATMAGVPGAAENAVRLDDPVVLREASEKLRALASSGGRVLVAGGGLTGIEAATELAERLPGLRVTLATRGRLGDGYAEAGAFHLRERFGELGISLAEGRAVVSVEPGRAWLEDGDKIPFDLAVWAGGFAAPALAREAGLPVDGSGRVLVDQSLRVAGHPNVFVAGDSAAAALPDGRTIRMGCVSAMPLGVHAGESVRRLLRGKEPRPFSFGFALRCVSLGRRDGLVQFVTPDDAPLPRVWARRRAVLLKELICRMTYEVVRNELRFEIPIYRWPGPGRLGIESAGGPAARPAQQA